MAEPKTKPKVEALSRRLPESIRISVDGKEIVVAGSRTENTFLNKVLAGQLRSLLQEQLKKYRDKEVTLTPKELAELVRAGSELGKMSGEVYKDEEPENGNRRPEEKTVSGDIEVSFDGLTKPKEDKKDEQST